MPVAPPPARIACEMSGTVRHVHEGRGAPRSAGTRTRISVLLAAAAAASIATALLGFGTGPAAGRERAAGATVVKVTAGKPTELAFTLSRSSALPWSSAASTLTFQVTNRGALAHRFEVCPTPVASASRNACEGKATRRLAPGQSATLTVAFPKRGTYEYLSSVPGQAAAGMKGLIGIGVALPRTSTTTSKTTTTTPKATTTTTTQPATTTTATGSTPVTTTPALTGAAAEGQAVWNDNGCSDCHSLAEVEAASGGNVSPDLNSSHSGGPFPNGPLSATQISQLAAYVAAG